MKEFLKKYGLYVLCTFLIISYISQCSVNNDYEDKIEEQSIAIDSLNKVIYNTATINQNNLETIQTFFMIEGYRISRRMLYDNNKIIRIDSDIRPDDRMNEYSQEIDKLRIRLDSLTDK